MKTKIFSGGDEGGRKQKQVSYPKKRKILKQESRLRNEVQPVKRSFQKPSSKFKKKLKKSLKNNSNVKGPKKSVSFSENLEGENSGNVQKRKPKARKGISKKSPSSFSKQSKSILKKKKASVLNAGKAPSEAASKRKRPHSDSVFEASAQEEPKKIKLCEMKVKERKRFRKQQKAAKIFDMAMAAKNVWEEIRRDDCSEEKRKNLVSELMNLTKGHIKQLIFAHDTVRVIECLVAVGNNEQRAQLFDELKGDILSVAKSKYAKFFLIKILNYGTKEQKDIIMKSFKGQLVSLVKHTEAAHVVETAFNDWANAKQRSEMVQEFYGPSFTVFKDDDARNLEDILVKHPDQKAAIVNHIKEVLLKITEKSVIRHSIVHHILREFMVHADAKSRSELIESIRDAVVEILHTKDGSRVAMSCIWHGTVKDRKKIVKSMKMHVCKVAKEEQGCLVLMAIFDCLDDNKLVQQVVITKLFHNFLELAEDVHGRKVLTYLLCPRDSHFFHPHVVNILKVGDNNEHSKKSPDVRREEFQQAASPLLLKHAEEHAEALVKTNATCMFLLTILQHSLGDKKGILESIFSLLHSPYQVRSGSDLHPLEQPALHFLLKKLLHLEKSRNLSQTDGSVSEVLVSSLPEGIMKTWVDCNRGAFLLLNLLECGVASVVARIAKELKGTYSHLKSKEYKGSQLLLAELRKHHSE